jgi:hypothetical protein
MSAAVAPGRRRGDGEGVLMRRPHGALVAALALAGWAACAAGARAQITFQPSTASFGAQMGGQVLDIQRDSLRRAVPTRRVPSPGGGPTEGSPTAVVTTYRAQPAVTARAQRQFVDFVRTTSGAAGADAMAHAFASQDLVQSWARQAQPDGMRPGDVADAMAEYWVTNWMMANHQTTASPEQVRGVREQVRRALAGDAAFRRLDEAGRQELAEAMMYNTLLQGTVYQAALQRHDAALETKLSDAAVARFRNEARVDLRAVALTPAGLARRG